MIKEEESGKVGKADDKEGMNKKNTSQSNLHLRCFGRSE
jgi:hypothetical protein